MSRRSSTKTTHLAMQEVDESGSPVAWGEHVTDEEYLAKPSPEA